jgi:hypothetical protein
VEAQDAKAAHCGLEAQYEAERKTETALEESAL